MKEYNWYELLGKALDIAYDAHKGQERECNPYILHPLRVMDACQTLPQKVVALLHDVVEDSDWTSHALGMHGFPPLILDAVEAITHYDNESLKEYRRKVCSNKLALEVKTKDSQDNLQRSLALPDGHPKKNKWVTKYTENLELMNRYYQQHYL